jgi:hypothetical protein
MAGLDPAIHVELLQRRPALAPAAGGREDSANKIEALDKRVDGRVKPGHDGGWRGDAHFADLPGVVYFAKSAP